MVEKTVRLINGKISDSVIPDSVARRVGGNIAVMSIDVDGGAAIESKETYLNANISVKGGGYSNYTGRTQIRGRGNYTWGLPKKPYRLKLTVAASILGIPSERDFALLANHTDATSLNTALAMNIGQNSSGLAWTPKSAFVELVLNGQYVGVYQLIETVKISKTAARVPGPVATGTSGDLSTGTFLLEIDPQYGQSAPGFTTTKGVRVIYDDPDGTVADNATYIKNKVQTFEDVLYGSNFTDPTNGYRPLVNVDSFIDWYLIEELGSNQDSPFNSSCKLFKTADNSGVAGKINMGPLWDFDIAFGNVVNTAHPSSGLFTRPGAKWIHRMMADPYFADRLNTRWLAMVSRLNDATSGYAAVLDRLNSVVLNSRDENNVLWNIETRWDSNVAAKKAWIGRRIDWLTTEFAASVDGSRGDNEANAAPSVTNTSPPTISGTPNSSQTLTVMNGSWSVIPDSYGYQWKKGGANISGQTASTYVVQSSDVGAIITCLVTAVKSGYTSGSATTSGVTIVAAGSQPSTGSFSASTVPNISAWYMAENAGTSNNQAVSSWTDQSGNNFTATQETVANQPVLILNVLNNRPVVRFSGNPKSMDSTAPAGNSAQTIFAVTKHSTNSSTLTIRGADNQEGLQYRIAGGKQQFVKQAAADLGSATTSLSTADFSIHSADFAANNKVNFYLNGSANGTVTINTGVVARTTMIGAQGSNGEYFQGDIAEIIVYNAVLSAGDRAKVHTYLSDKYGISVSDRV